MSKFLDSTISKSLAAGHEESKTCMQMDETSNRDDETDQMLASTENFVDDESEKSSEVVLRIDCGDDDDSDERLAESRADNEDSDGCGGLSCCSILHKAVCTFMADRSTCFKHILIGILMTAFFVYFIVALVFAAISYCPYENDVFPLVVLTCVYLSLFVMSYVWSKFGDRVKDGVLVPLRKVIDHRWDILRWVALFLPLAGIAAVIVSTILKSPHNLICLVGISFFLLLLFVFSSAPTKINCRPVIGGLILQFYVAVLILRWDYGYRFFSLLGTEARKFLTYTDVGSKFVFGEKFTDHIFVMQVLPVVVFFSCVISMLYYLGVMQRVISVIAMVMRCTLGTTAAESLCAAGNIFVGQTEAPILIRPFLAVMTKSEIHAVMVGGFATIAGGVLAAYIKFGIPPEHLLCASVMNAPCSLAISKLLYPETEKSRISKTKAMMNSNTQYGNLVEAAAAGAAQAIPLVANIAVNLIAFLALLSFVNATIAWFGSFVCLPDLSFEMICHFVLKPVVYLMGVRWEDAGQVAELIALKTFLNEFVAYEQLSEIMNNRLTCATDGPILSPRSEMIATYALCGFSNISAIGVVLGGLGPMAPHRISDMASVVVSALFGGITVCLITASIAGLLVTELPADALLCTLGNHTVMENTTAVLDLLT